MSHVQGLLGRLQNWGAWMLGRLLISNLVAGVQQRSLACRAWFGLLGLH